MGRRSKRPTPRFHLGGKKKTIRPIVMKYCYGLDEHLQYHTGEMVIAKYWNQKFQKIRTAKGYEKEATEIMQYLDKLKSKALEIFDEMGVITIQDFRNELDYRMGFALRPEEQQRQQQHLTLMQFIPKFIEKRKSRAGAEQEKGTNKNFGVWYNNLKDYCTYVKRDIDYKDIDWNWLESFKDFCLKEKNHSRNNVQKGITYIKQFVNAARREGYTENRIVTERGFNIKKVPTTKVTFYIDDLEKLHQFKCPNNRLQKVKNLNMIGALTGMRHNMWGKITKDLVKVVKGEKFIEIFTTKTKAQIAVPLDPMLEETLERINWEVPSMTRQKFSDYSKELWELVGIAEKIEHIDSRGGEMKITLRPKYELFHPHCLRRSFASIFFLAGLPAALLMQITGHRTEKMFFQYINIEKRLTAAYVSRYMKQLKQMKDLKSPLQSVKQ